MNMRKKRLQEAEVRRMIGAIDSWDGSDNHFMHLMAGADRALHPSRPSGSADKWFANENVPGSYSVMQGILVAAKKRLRASLR